MKEDSSESIMGKCAARSSFRGIEQTFELYSACVIP